MSKYQPQTSNFVKLLSASTSVLALCAATPAIYHLMQVSSNPANAIGLGVLSIIGAGSVGYLTHTLAPLLEDYAKDFVKSSPIMQKVTSFRVFDKANQNKL